MRKLRFLFDPLPSFVEEGKRERKTIDDPTEDSQECGCLNESVRGREDACLNL
jgi:hypothetical protein